MVGAVNVASLDHFAWCDEHCIDSDGVHCAHRMRVSDTLVIEAAYNQQDPDAEVWLWIDGPHQGASPPFTERHIAFLESIADQGDLCRTMNALLKMGRRVWPTRETT